MLTVLLLFQQHLAASFVIGFALALSSTAFVLQLLTEKQQLNTTYGQQSFQSCFSKTLQQFHYLR